MVYETQQRKLSKVLMDEIKNNEEINYSMLLATMHIEGFKKNKVEEMLGSFERMSYIKINKKEDKIFSYIYDGN